jgi:hypothetical protein
MKDMAKVARKFTAKKGDSNAREVSELSLDIIQAWGEAFLPKSKMYPNFAKVYHELRKEGLPFRPQYDESRVPVFTPPPSIPDDPNFPEDAYFESPNTMMDAELAAALALSMAESNQKRGPQERRPSHPLASNHQHPTYHHTEAVESARTPFHQGSSASRSQGQHHHHQRAMPAPAPAAASSAEIVSGCQSSMMILQEIILAAQSGSEFRTNDIAEEVAAQLRIQQGALGTAIERELGAGTGQVFPHPHPSLISSLVQEVETMFKINDDAGLLIQLYSGLKSGETQLSEAKVLLESLFPSEIRSEPAPVANKPPVAVPNDDLLDLFLSAPSQTQQTTPPPSNNVTKPTPTPAPKAIALAPPPPTPSRVLPPSLRQAQQQTHATADSLDIFGEPLRPAQPAPVSAPPAQPALDIFGDPIKPGPSSQTFPEEDPFSSKVSIDDIMSQPTAPAPAPPLQQFPQYPQYPSAPLPSAPSNHLDPFAISQSPPLAAQSGYPASAPHQSPPALLDPFDSFLSHQPAPAYPPSYPPASQAPQPPSQQQQYPPSSSNNPFDLF